MKRYFRSVYFDNKIFGDACIAWFCRCDKSINYFNSKICIAHVSK